MSSTTGYKHLGDVNFQSAESVEVRQPMMTSSINTARRRQDSLDGRLISASGERLVQRHMPPMMRLYRLRDVFLSLLHWKWPYTLVVVCLAYCVSWAIFAGLWLLLHKTDPSCLSLSKGNTTSFNSLFIFSTVVQTSIGFGNDFIQGGCEAGSALLVIQCLVGYIMDGVLMGLILTKALRAKSRAQTIHFSPHGVVCQRNGVLCLLFRLVDLRLQSVCEAHIRAYCYRPERTQEGEVLDWECRELDLGYDVGRDRILLLLPVTACHYITETSPFYGLSKDEVLSGPFEIILLLEGAIEATGLNMQAMRSYTHRDILWGHQFVPMVKLEQETGEVGVDFAQLDATKRVELDTRQST